jgi:hypothetical protein
MRLQPVRHRHVGQGHAGRHAGRHCRCSLASGTSASATLRESCRARI